MTTERRILWEHGLWRCEFWPQTDAELASIRVFSGDKLLFVYSDRSSDALLHIAEDWSRVYAEPWGEENPSPQMLPPGQPDIRDGPTDRRRVRRGGRRATE
jgi:hypothetical protein